MTIYEPNVLRNFTLHSQGPREIELARLAGFQLSPHPEGFDLPTGTPLQPHALRFAAQLRDAARSGHAVLAGGHTAVWIAAVLSIPAAELPRLYYFETERTRDENGRFIFTPLRLCPINLL